MIKRITFFLSLVYSLTCYSQSVAPLDPAFGVNGISITDFGASAKAWCITKQPDGKLIAAGYSGFYSAADFAVVRYSSDGIVDSSFGTNGKVTTPFGTIQDYAKCVRVQTDGKIVVAGYSDNGNDEDFALARYNSNGSLDSSFGINGKVVTPMGNATDFLYTMEIQSDGKILLCGGIENGFHMQLGMVRYNTTGSIDSSFGTAGKVFKAIGSADTFMNDLTIQPDGKIITAGSSSYGSTLFRFDTDGNMDTTFGNAGVVTTSSFGLIKTICLQPDNKILAAGGVYNSHGFDFTLARYNPDGSLDATFGSSGKVTTYGGLAGPPKFATIDSSGKILVIGDVTIIKYLPNGNLDNGFGLSGKMIYDIPAYDEYIYEYVAQSDSKIVLAGASERISTPSNFLLARIDLDLSLDVPNIPDKETVFLYPNPTADKLFIQVNDVEIGEVNIYNATGYLVSQTKQSKTNYVDVSQFANGVYIAEIKTKDESIKRMWVKM